MVDDFGSVKVIEVTLAFEEGPNLWSKPTVKQVAPACTKPRAHGDLGQTCCGRVFQFIERRTQPPCCPEMETPGNCHYAPLSKGSRPHKVGLSSLQTIWLCEGKCQARPLHPNTVVRHAASTMSSARFNIQDTARVEALRSTLQTVFPQTLVLAFASPVATATEIFMAIIMHLDSEGPLGVEQIGPDGKPDSGVKTVLGPVFVVSSQTVLSQGLDKG